MVGTGLGKAPGNPELGGARSPQPATPVPGAETPPDVRGRRSGRPTLPHPPVPDAPWHACPGPLRRWRRGRIVSSWFSGRLASPNLPWPQDARILGSKCSALLSPQAPPLQRVLGPKGLARFPGSEGEHLWDLAVRYPIFLSPYRLGPISVRHQYPLSKSPNPGPGLKSPEV